MESLPIATLSSNTLFHFTDKLRHLENILEAEFQAHFCLEDLRFMEPNPSRVDDEELRFALPMVSFCDIPLSQTQDHLSTYGDYGIGLSKEWGRRAGITPVLYAHSDSHLLSHIREAILETGPFRTGPDKAPYPDGLPDFVAALARILFFIKPYEGSVLHADGSTTSVRFYDEREWRFVPHPYNGPYRFGMPEKDFRDEEKLRSAQAKIGASGTLSFEPSDIRYLIVPREADVLPTMTAIKEIKSDKYDDDSVRMLQSRIVTAQQIREDF